MQIDLTGKVALISGGSSGIGEATARAMVAAGARVVIGDVNSGDGERIARELGGCCAFRVLDVTRLDAWEGAVETAVREFGHLDILVSNAGVIDGGELGTFSSEQWDRLVSVNLKGAFLGLTASRDALCGQGGGSVILVSSIAGLQGTAGYSAYCASKFGLRGLMKAAALELAPHKVRVNSIHPGTVRTAMTAGLPDEFAQSCALGRFGDAAEIANLALFLASDLAAFSTGSEFVADGGESAGAMRRFVSPQT